MKKITISNNILFLAIPFMFGLLFCNIANAESANFYLNQSINEKKGIIEVSLNVNSSSIVNAGQSTINFNNKDLEIVGIEYYNNSIFNLWMKSPRYSNSKGYIYFAGGSTDGFVGKGELFTMKFKIKNQEIKTTELVFNKSLILAADGKGTNILSDSNKENIYLN